MNRFGSNIWFWLYCLIASASFLTPSSFGTDYFFASQYRSINVGVVSHSAIVDWNQDSFPDLILFAKEIVYGFPWPNSPQSMTVVINDRRGGIGDSWTLDGIQSWKMITEAELDGIPPHELLAITNEGLQLFVLQSDKSLHLQPPWYFTESLEAVYPLDEDQDGITESLIIEERVEETVTQKRMILNSTQDALIPGNDSPIPSQLTKPLVQSINGESRFAITLGSGQITWSDLQNENTSVTLHGPILGGVVLDWDRDGIDDLFTGEGVMIFKGLLEGGFDTGYTRQTSPVSLTPRFPAGGYNLVGDINEDGLVDRVSLNVAIYHPMSGPVSVQISFGRNNATPSLEDYNWIVGETDGFSCYAFLFDFDHDTHLDLLITNAGGPWVFYRGKGNGTFDDPRTLSGAFSYSYTIPQLADFNGDDNPDFVAILSAADYQVSPGVFIALGNDDLTYQRYSFAFFSPDSQYWGVGYNPTVKIGDTDNDGLDDILFNDTNLWINQWTPSSSVNPWNRYP